MILFLLIHCKLLKIIALRWFAKSLSLKGNLCELPHFSLTVYSSGRIVGPSAIKWQIVGSVQINYAVPRHYKIKH